MLIKTAVAAWAAAGVLAGTGTPVPRPGHEPAPPRGHTVISCQSDDTEQIDEFNDDDEPRHTVIPGTNRSCPQRPVR